MSAIAGLLQQQVQRLNDALRQQQERRCRELVGDAERSAKQAVRDARRRLGERQRQAVREERQRREHELLIAQSRIETHARRRAFARHEQFLEAAWPLMIDSMTKRWSDAGQRRAWCNMIVAEAADCLMGTDWVVEHPKKWTKADSDAVERHMRELALPAAKFVRSNDITTGLRIRVGTACLDGTTDGLLGDRGDVEALLLAAWEQQDATNNG